MGLVQDQSWKGLAPPQSIREAARSKGVEVRSVCTETIFPLRDYVDKAGGVVGKLPNSYGAFEGLMGKLGKVPQPLESPTRQTLPEQDHGAMEGKMLPPDKPTGGCFLKYVLRENLKL